MATSGAEIGELVTRVTRILRRRSRDLPVNPHQLRALRHIAAEPIRPARLAEVLRVTPRAVTDVVDALHRQGLITATPDPQDRRAKILTITDKGEEQRRIAKAMRDDAAQDLFSTLTDDEAEHLAGLLRKVIDDLGETRHTS